MSEARFTYWRKRHGDREEAFISDTDIGLSMRIHGYADQVEFFVDCFAMTTDRHDAMPEPAAGPTRRDRPVDPNQTTIYDHGG